MSLRGAIMIQGAGSNVGKSLIVAGLCRLAARKGVRVAPFKPQNMSNNAAAAQGGEIGRAQALQARAAGIEAHIDMNPVLLKPESEQGSQVIVQGKRFATVRAHEYALLKVQLLGTVLQSYRRLQTMADLIIVEGAGSPAEVNLRQGDIANMGFAESADIPVIMVGDIDRGGVIAQLVGAKEVLDAHDAARVKGFVINKFRGDLTLFNDGYRFIQERTGWRGLGVAPWFDQAVNLPAEDSADLKRQRPQSNGAIKIVVPSFARIANFDDLDPLFHEPDVNVQIIEPGCAMPGDADLILLPGSKSTRGDLAFLRRQGWDIDIKAHIRRGGFVLGLCGGYQMLGRMLHDPQGLEGDAGSSVGLSALDIETTITPRKQVRQTTGVSGLFQDTPISGYEIHLGETYGEDCARPFVTREERNDGAISETGRVFGCYVHGLLASDAFRKKFLALLGGRSSGVNFNDKVDRTLDALADHCEAHLDTDRIYGFAH